MFVNKLFTYLTCAYLRKSKRCFNVKSSTYYFHVKTKISADFQTCISVPLNQRLKLFTFGMIQVLCVTEFIHLSWLGFYNLKKLKDTHREKAPSNKTPPLTKSMNMDIWVVGTSNHGNVAFSILVYSAKKQYCSFLKNIFIFQKICFKVKVLETFKISSDCHIKTSRSLKSKVTLKILSTVF